MPSTTSHITPERRRRFCGAHLLALSLILAVLVSGVALAADTAPANPLLSLAIGNFATSGLDPSVGVAADGALRDALAGQPLLDLKNGPRVGVVLSANRAALLANRPGAARTVADQLATRVIAFGTLWADADGQRFLQMVAVDCRPRVPHLYATPSLPWPDDPAAQKTRLLSALQAVLPPVARVIALITAGGHTDIQLFPFGGIPLKTSTAYLTYHTLAAEAAPARADYLPVLWTGGYSGKVTTAAQRLDDAIYADSADPSRVEIGDLVGLALTDEIAFLPSPGYLLLSDPPVARVSKAGRVLGVTPLLLSSADATGDLTVSATDFIDKPFTLPASAALLDTSVIAMAPLPLTGTLSVTSDPPGAVVTIDGQNLGATPVVSGALKPGDHTLVATLAGYHPITQTVTIARGAQAQAQVAFERITRTVTLTSTPAGAEVFWDGQDLGQAPVTVDKSPIGKHSVKLTLPDYDDFTSDVEVDAGDQPAPLTFELSHLAGKLVVVTTPAGAQILVEGQPRGLSPAAIGGLYPNDYQITATLAGYRAATQTVTVKAHETNTVTIALMPQSGQISIKTVPAGAAVKLDGKDRGVTPLVLDNVSPGDHTLRLEVPNLRPWEGKVSVVDGQTTEIQVGLLPLQMDVTNAHPGPEIVPAPTVLASLPAATSPASQESEGDDPVFPLLALAGGEMRSWAIPVLGPTDQNGQPTDKLEMEFQPHADGGLTVSLHTQEPLGDAVTVEQSAGNLSACLPNVRLEHNPAGLQIGDATLRSIRLTNTGPGGALRVDFAVSAGAQVNYSRSNLPTSELQIHIAHAPYALAKKMVALTFDDMPFPDGTGRLLDILRQYKVVATFFVIGHKAAEYPGLIRRAHDEGHSLQNHTWSHAHLALISPEEARAELTRCSDIIEQITGERPTWFRPPGGGIDAQVRAVASDLGLRFAGWQVACHDYNVTSSKSIEDYVVANTHAGDVILLHDGIIPTMDALPGIITKLRAEGVTFVTMDELYGRPH
jgi:peptidoglycan/xylan/chitin deacetylase (PgdA/CDA1 family)